MNEITINPCAVGNKLRALRGAKTLEYVSEETGIGRSALNMYELGMRTPRDETKIKLATYYGVSVADLFFDERITYRD